jgi:hypothetical protein
MNMLLHSLSEPAAPLLHHSIQIQIFSYTSIHLHHPCLIFSGLKAVSGRIGAGNGTADITQVFTAALSAEEREAISFDQAEYAQAQWVDPASVIQSNSYHTFLRRQAAGPLLRRALMHAGLLHASIATVSHLYCSVVI